ncbi:MAG: hypothetical protein JSW45_07485 [Thiotrichales bacterium]|nr:MAG: hypothetical protein JSW45_07485 [Thiotrichales bacterium]
MVTRICSGLPGRIVLATLVLCLGGCATYSQQATSMRDNLLVGRADLARQTAEKEDQNENDVLACLNKGMLRRMTDDYVGSNQIFEIAKQRMESLYGVSITRSAASVAINDAVREYKGDQYEQVLLHAYMAMNYLQLGELDSARVEMLQADVKMMEWGEQPDEDPFVRYFAGMIYEALGEPDQALVSYRKAHAVYNATRNEQNLDVPLMLKKDLLRLLAEQGLTDEYTTMKSEFGLANFSPAEPGDDFGELIIILNNGLAPIRTETSIMTFSSEVQGHVRVAFPVYETEPNPARKARLNVSGKLVDLETVENIDSLARQALDEDMPLVMARAIARAVVKYQSQKKVNEQDALAGFLLTVTNLATERADTRSWTTLPQEIQMARVMLPAGEHDVSIEIVNAAGRVIDAVEARVDIEPMQHRFLTRHWIAPVPLNNYIATKK